MDEDSGESKEGKLSDRHRKSRVRNRERGMRLTE